jgi:hypothetical protein
VTDVDPSKSISGVPRTRLLGLFAFCLSAVLLIPAELYLVGGAAWVASAVLLFSDTDRAVRRRMGVLLGTIVLLTIAPINTDTRTPHFVTLALFFLAAVLGPALILGRTDPGVIRYRIWPRRFRRLDLGYVLISIPLCWVAFELYFGVLSPEVPRNWYLPPEKNMDAVWRLFAGINGVGIWDELFFVNTVFAVLRSIFPMRIANPAQAVIYTAVLADMAFTGWGPAFVYLFALTQGAMFEESENLLYVLVVHLIVDAFLFAGIVDFYYPGFSPVPF